MQQHNKRSDSALSEPLLSLSHDDHQHDHDHDEGHHHYHPSTSAIHRQRHRSGMGFTWKHILYLIVMMTIGAALLDAIINGGLAALMYHDQGNIRVWEWPNTLGGDIIITTLLTGILTWLIASNLVMRDLRVGVPLLGKMGSLNLYSPEFRRGKFYNYFLRMEDLIRLPGKGNWKKHFVKFVLLVLRGIPFTLIWFVIFAPATLAVMMALEYGADINLWWPSAVVFKAIWGGGMGLFVTPAVGVLAMASYEDNEAEAINSSRSDATDDDSESGLKSEPNSTYGTGEEEEA
jgi:hypothetical protein